MAKDTENTSNELTNAFIGGNIKNTEMYLHAGDLVKCEEEEPGKMFVICLWLELK